MNIGIGRGSIPLAWVWLPVILAGCGDAKPHAAAGERVACQSRDELTVCTIPAAQVSTIRIAAAPEPGSQPWTIASLDSSLRTRGRRLVAAMNAGIFGTDRKPLGLLVTEGTVIRKLNRSIGPAVAPPATVCDLANFYCPPNGVFAVVDGRALVATTTEYGTMTPPPAPIVATQSGPMLVHDGKLAREFPATWRRAIDRNAVCVRSDGTALFVLGRSQTQGQFAAALLGELACADALYLDGSISELYIGDGCPSPSFNDYAAILYVSEPIPRGDKGCGP